MLSFLLLLTCSERCDTKPLTRANQVRPRDPQAKKQHTATQPASSKAAGSTAGTARNKEGSTGTKKTAKTTGKAGLSTQTKANPRNNNNINRGTGKFSRSGVIVLAWSLHADINFTSQFEVKRSDNPASSRLVITFPIPIGRHVLQSQQCKLSK